MKYFFSKFQNRAHKGGHFIIFPCTPLEYSLVADYYPKFENDTKFRCSLPKAYCLFLSTENIGKMYAKTFRNRQNDGLFQHRLGLFAKRIEKILYFDTICRLSLTI